MNLNHLEIPRVKSSFHFKILKIKTKSGMGCYTTHLEIGTPLKDRL